MDFEDKIRESKKNIPDVATSNYQKIYKWAKNKNDNKEPKKYGKRLIISFTSITIGLVVAIVVLSFLLTGPSNHQFTGNYAKLEKAFSEIKDNNKFTDGGLNVESLLGASREDTVPPTTPVTNDALTRNQEENVDENDIIRKNGDLVFYFYGDQKNNYGKNYLVVSKIEGGNTKILSKTTIVGDNYDSYSMNLFLYNNYCIVTITYKGVTNTHIYDYSNPSNLDLVASFVQDGTMKEVRKVGNEMFVFSSLWVEYNYDAITDIIPKVDDEMLEPNEVLVPPCVSYFNFIVISKINLDSLEVDEKLCIAGAANSDIYMTENQILIATKTYETITNYRSFLDQTTKTSIVVIDKDEFTSDNAKTMLINGHLQSRFSVDISGDYLRVTTTSSKSEFNRPWLFYGSWNFGNNEVNVYIYDLRTCEKTGAIENFAPLYESVKSAYYDVDTLYVVTYFVTDPVYKIDLSNPSNPVIVADTGEIPGYSSYLYSFGEYLIGFGYVTGWSGLQISVYSLDNQKITLITKLEFENSYPSYDKNGYYIDEDKLEIGFVTDEDNRSDKSRYNVYTFDGTNFVVKGVFDFNDYRYYAVLTTRCVVVDGIYYVFTRSGLYVYDNMTTEVCFIENHNNKIID